MAETTHRVDPTLYHFATQEHRKEFERMVAQIDEQNKEIKKHRWIPVSERLPELYDCHCPHPHSPDVLLALSEVYLGWFEKDRGWRHGDGTVEVFPTHWKPIILPEQA